MLPFLRWPGFMPVSSQRVTLAEAAAGVLGFGVSVCFWRLRWPGPRRLLAAPLPARQKSWSGPGINGVVKQGFSSDGGEGQVQQKNFP